ncbi:MAG: aspartate carbamoyltransferase [Dehalococcoidia bacterium]|nr:aspartate carbamoyltransferase [Dehalococcoidia bacterium]
MNLAGRDLVTIDDLSNEEIESVFTLADEMSDSIGGQFGVCQGKVMASLFFEPSTRTRLSFEAAMNRLGGRVISVVEMSNTSLAKGESIADMARVVGSYADIIVIRHLWEGAARVVADYSDVPVINAGDGGHEHPTQTLCDLYTLKKERKTLEGLKIALWGDLKYGRTVHSLAYALARFGATIHFRPSPGLEMPEHVTRKLATEYTGRLEKYDGPRALDEKGLFPLDAIYMTPSGPHQLANIPAVGLEIELEKGVDALYVTRVQKERLGPESRLSKKGYPVVDRKLLREKGFEETMVMHPLPRVDELAYEMDADPRSMYFKQAARGLPIRMALVSLILGAREAHILQTKKPIFARKVSYPAYTRDTGIRCPNRVCVSSQETESRYIRPEFLIVSTDPLILRCAYCEHEIRPRYIASSKWHQGTAENKRYYAAKGSMISRINPDNIIIFDSESAAQEQGFKPGRRLVETGAQEGEKP